MNTSIKMACIATTLALFACSSSTTAPKMDDIKGGVRLHMQVESPVSLGKKIAVASALTITDAAGTEFTLTGARVVIGKVKFTSADTSDSAMEVDSEISGPILADLLAGTMSPDPGSLVIASGTYSEIKVGIEKVTEEMGLVDASDPLNDNSMHIQGSWVESDILRTFSMAIKFDEELRFENPEGIAIDSSSSQQIRISLNATQWLSDIDFTACLHEEEMGFPAEGTLYINDDNAKGACDLIEELVKKNIKNHYEVQNEVED